MKAVLITLGIAISSLLPTMGLAKPLTSWTSNTCRPDPFDERNVDCNIFVVEDRIAPEEELGLVIVRFSASAKGDYFVLQFLSKKNPPKLRGDQLQQDLLLRVDKNSIRTYEPAKVFINRKLDGGIYPTVMLDESLLQEMLDGKTISVRYASVRDGSATASFSLAGFPEAIRKMAADIKDIKSSDK